MASKTGGDCYQVHGQAMLNGTLVNFGNIKLCHGTVWHPDTEWHGHCWVEVNNDMIIDISNGRQVITRRELYYSSGYVKDVYRYTSEQVIELMLKHETYGPWNDK